MYVDPKWRRKGVNQTIINKLIQWLKERGILEVRLDVYDENEGAIKAYEKLGFKSVLMNMRMTF